MAERYGRRLLLVPADGPVIADDHAAVDIVGEAFHQQADLIVLPVERLPDTFFSLRTGVAGLVVGKFTTYHLCLAVVGDISAHLARSETLRAYVAETNRGRQVWFVADLAELDARLARAQAAPGRPATPTPAG